MFEGQLEAEIVALVLEQQNYNGWALHMPPLPSSVNLIVLGSS